MRFGNSITARELPRYNTVGQPANGGGLVGEADASFGVDDAVDRLEPRAVLVKKSNKRQSIGAMLETLHSDVRSTSLC